MNTIEELKAKLAGSVEESAAARKVLAELVDLAKNHMVLEPIHQDPREVNFNKLVDEGHLSMPGLHFRTLGSYVDGNVSINKKGIISVPLKFDIMDLGSKCSDLRAVLAPHCNSNELVPTLCFVSANAALPYFRSLKL